jgi:ATP-dependent DNA helicase RecG
LFKIDEGVDGGVNGGVNDILLLIKNNPGINVSIIKSLLNVPQRTIERWINQLKKENKIEFKGAPKTGGYWEIDDRQ